MKIDMNNALITIPIHFIHVFKKLRRCLIQLQYCIFNLIEIFLITRHCHMDIFTFYKLFFPRSLVETDLNRTSWNGSFVCFWFWRACTAMRSIRVLFHRCSRYYVYSFLLKPFPTTLSKTVLRSNDPTHDSTRSKQDVFQKK